MNRDENRPANDNLKGNDPAQESSRGQSIRSILRPRLPRPWALRSAEIRSRDRDRMRGWAERAIATMRPRQIDPDTLRAALTDPDEQAPVVMNDEARILEENRMIRLRALSSCLFFLLFFSMVTLAVTSDRVLISMGATGGLMASMSLLSLAIRADWRLLELRIDRRIGLKSWFRLRVTPLDHIKRG